MSRAQWCIGIHTNVCVQHCSRTYTCAAAVPILENAMYSKREKLDKNGVYKCACVYVNVRVSMCESVCVISVRRTTFLSLLLFFIEAGLNWKKIGIFLIYLWILSRLIFNFFSSYFLLGPRWYLWARDVLNVRKMWWRFILQMWTLHRY